MRFINMRPHCRGGNPQVLQRRMTLPGMMRSRIQTKRGFERKAQWQRQTEQGRETKEAPSRPLFSRDQTATN